MFRLEICSYKFYDSLLSFIYSIFMLINFFFTDNVEEERGESMEITKRTIRSISSTSEQEILFLDDDDVSNTNDTDFSYMDNNTDTGNTNTDAMRPQAHHLMDTKSMVSSIVKTCCFTVFMEFNTFIFKNICSLVFSSMI